MVDYDNEDFLSALQDILDECVNGRTEGHKCPACGNGELVVELVEDVSLRLECQGCGKYFDGRLR